MSQQDQPMREVAQRTFAREFNDATYTFRESDDDRAPVYVLLPTGAKANRVFIAGTLTETNDVGSDDEYWQGRIVDPTGRIFAYAGQYQPEAARTLRETEPPAFVAVVGKPRTYETDDGNINVSLRPEHVTIVDEHTRNRWVTETAKRTLERITHFGEQTNEYARMAREQYGDSVEQYRQAVITAAESLESIPDADSATDTPNSTNAGTDPPTTTSESVTSTSETGDTGTESLTEPEDRTDSLGEFDTD